MKKDLSDNKPFSRCPENGQQIKRVSRHFARTRKMVDLVCHYNHFVDVNKMERRLISEQKKLLGRPEPLEP